MLENASKSLESDSQDDDVQKGADLKVVRLCTMVSDYSSILEILHSDPQADFSALRLGALTVDECTQLIAEGAIAPESTRKINAELNKLRQRCTQLLVSRFEHLEADDNEVEASVDGSSRPSTPVARRTKSHDALQGAYTVAASKLLSAVSIHLTNSQVAPVAEYGVSCVDSLICLARINLAQPGIHPRTIRESLDRAASVARKLASELDAQSSALLKSTSSAFWTVAVTLFNRGQHATAVPFLTQSCHLVQELQGLKLPNAADQGLQANQLSISNVLPKRWELLGFCQSRTGDRRLAYDAFQRGIVSSRHFFPQVAGLSHRILPANLFLSSPGMRSLESLLERLTLFTTHELLDCSPVTLLDIFSDMDIPTTDEEKEAMLMEVQLSTLRRHPGFRLKESQTMQKKIMDSCLVVYNLEYPIRRIRILMKMLTFFLPQ
ncbi:uncharacterized protein EI90DRAFT_2366715 [Cantharellus anzutake]|uniref:uncharacterized protein n=1 Tax=Cantharellus anzutake TaxID=1750568 RepID=UPI001908AC0E|nr:uncharacterized protein EI90DRAFT_2366715 [Cantharellus anzutake]KAF8324196.1 hypothetical protein EI90DRAFT_2366715 [Cantharellus anzutake]